MPFSALALVLVAAALHAAWNLAAKKAAGDHHFIFMAVCLIAVLWSPALLWFGPQELPRWTLQDWALVACSGFIHVLYFSALLKGYRVADLTVVYPVARGSGPLLTALGAALFLDESLGPLSLAGIAVMVLGIVLITGLPPLRGAVGRPFRASAHGAPAGLHQCNEGQRLRAGLIWGALTGVTIAAYTVVDGWAVRVALLSPILYDYFANVLRLPFLLPWVWRDRARAPAAWRAHWKPAVVLAVCSPAAYVLVLTAMTLAPVSHVAPAREVSMLFAAMLGGRLLAEQNNSLRLLGAAAMALGVTLLTMA